MTRTLLNAFVCLFPVVLLEPAAQADATLTMQDVGGKMDSVIEVKDHMVRISTPGQPDYMLFDTKRDVAIHVSSVNRQYMEIDRAALAEMAESVTRMQKQMAPQMAKMREQLKNMPPEQRAMIEQQMGGRVDLGAMEAKPVAEVTTVKRGSDKIAGFKCQRYDVMNDAQRVADVCVATSADAGMSKADFSTVSTATKFMRDMAAGAQKMSAGMGAPQMSMGDVEGVPVATRDLRTGREFRLVNVADDALDDARFNAYRSLSKREMPKMR
jgi:hypothetical protein